MHLEMEHAFCPLCGSKDSEVFRKAKDVFRVTDHEFVFVRCINCRLVYQNPHVTPETISTFYPHNYFSFSSDRNVKQSTLAEKKIQLKCQMIERFCHGPGKLLEIGSANGDFLVGMRNRGWNVQGVEISNDAAEFCQRKHNLKVFNGELLKRPDNGERFDVVVMWAVLPHISNPVPVVSYASQLLASHGKFIVCCANIDSFAAHYMKNNWGHLDLPRHYCMWSPSTVKKLFSMIGLTLIDIIHHDDIFSSNLILRWLYPFIKTVDDRPGITCKKLIRLIAFRANRLITLPILARARKEEKGGIITVVGEKKI